MGPRHPRQGFLGTTCQQRHSSIVISVEGGSASNPSQSHYLKPLLVPVRFRGKLNLRQNLSCWVRGCPRKQEWPLGRQLSSAGSVCEERGSIKHSHRAAHVLTCAFFPIASFYGESYVGLSTTEVSPELSLQLRFQTSKPQGLLFLAAGKIDCCLIELLSGILQVCFKKNL